MNAPEGYLNDAVQRILGSSYKIADQPSVTRTPKNSSIRPCRKGLKAVTCYVTPETRKQIRKLAWEQQKAIDRLMRDAIDCLFAKHGLAEIASAKTKGDPA